MGKRLPYKKRREGFVSVLKELRRPGQKYLFGRANPAQLKGILGVTRSTLLIATADKWQHALSRHGQQIREKLGLDEEQLTVLVVAVIAAPDLVHGHPKYSNGVTYLGSVGEARYLAIQFRFFHRRRKFVGELQTIHPDDEGTIRSRRSAGLEWYARHE